MSGCLFDAGLLIAAWVCGCVCVFDETVQCSIPLDVFWVPKDGAWLWRWRDVTEKERDDGDVTAEDFRKRDESSLWTWKRLVFLFLAQAVWVWRTRRNAPRSLWRFPFKWTMSWVLHPCLNRLEARPLHFWGIQGGLSSLALGTSRLFTMFRKYEGKKKNLLLCPWNAWYFSVWFALSPVSWDVPTGWPQLQHSAKSCPYLTNKLDLNDVIVCVFNVQHHVLCSFFL